VDTIRDFDSAFAVATADNELGALVMNAHCDLLKRVEFPDGSSKETMSCQVTDAEGWGEFGGTFPSTAFVDSGGECIWFSDYWATIPLIHKKLWRQLLASGDTIGQSARDGLVLRRSLDR
jgi:hypothetical protein